MNDHFNLVTKMGEIHFTYNNDGFFIYKKKRNVVGSSKNFNFNLEAFNTNQILNS